MNLKSTPRGVNGTIGHFPFAMLLRALAGLMLCVAPGRGSARQTNDLARAQGNAPGTRDLTDETGRRVAIPADVKRVVSLAPNLTEIVFALGKAEQLAGDTDFCDYPAAATRKPHVGGPVNPSIEEIVKLKPDLVLATKSINRRETVDALARLRLPVYVTDPHSVNGMITSLEHLGSALHSEQSAAKLAANLRERLANLDRKLTGAAPRRVFFVVWSDPLISIGRGTFVSDALRHADAQSVVDTTAEWPRISLEEVVRLQPEFLVFASSHGAETQHDMEALRSRPGWRDLEALRRGNVVVISDAIIRPAPRIVDAIEELARAIHSESFVSAMAHGGAREHLQRSRVWNLSEDIAEACACTR